MLRTFVATCLVLHVGCANDPYLAVANAQIANWNEMAEILAQVKEKGDLDAAEQRIVDKVRQNQAVAAQAKLLPPPDEKAIARLEARREQMQTAVNRFLGEMNRIKGLPGGSDFFERVSKIVTASPRGAP